MEYIKTVKENKEGGYLVNGTISVPKAEGNRHYRDIQKWISEGNKVEPFETKKEQAIREAKEKQDGLEQAIQAHLDSTAKENGYDSILSACSYAGGVNHFQEEGKAFVTWRGEIWAYCYQVLVDVQSETRTEPTIEELIKELPELVL